MKTCSVCGNTLDDLGLCDPYCPVIIAEDDQIRAEVANLPPCDDQELIELGMEVVALLRFNQLVARRARS